MAEGKRADGRSPVFAAAEYRGALRDLPNVAAWENLEPPQLSEISVPPTHNKALSPETTIVEGMRGAGKSFWTAVLANDTTRDFVAAEARLATNQQLVVRVGFGLDLSGDDFPSPQVMEALVDSRQAPDAIWRAVLLRHALKLLGKDLPFDNNWQAAVGWVATQPAVVAEMLATVDRELAAQRRTLLLLFDALDRLGGDWSRIRGLLTAALNAFREAAEWTEQHQRSDVRALHFQGVQQGVVQASRIRVRELQEDYPWVEPLLRALSRSTVPLSVDELAQHWTPACISESLAAAASKQRLPPRRYSSAGGRSLAALLEDLVELAVLYPTEDRKRYNMPDIFRVGFGIKRKGGVRPPR